MDGMNKELLNSSFQKNSGSNSVAWDDLKTLLLEPATSPSERVAEKIADEIRRLERQELAWKVLDPVWRGFILLVNNLSRDSPWLDILAVVVRNLQQTEGPLTGENPEDPRAFWWKDLPNLGSIVREDFNQDPTAEDIRDNSTPKDYKSWVSFHAWLARVMSRQFMWINFPIWVLRDAFEEPALKGAAMECRLEVAREWIEHAGEFLLKELTNNQFDLDSKFAASLGTGSLCGSGITPPGVGRWEFWKKRLLEIHEELDTLELAGTAVASWIPELVQNMNEIQEAGTVSSSATGEITKRPKQGTKSEAMEGTASRPDKGAAPEKGKEAQQGP